MSDEPKRDYYDNFLKVIKSPLRAIGVDGFLHSFAFWNLYSGRDSSGDRIMNQAMYKPGPVDFPIQFATMFTAEALLEAAFLGYGIYEAYKGNFDYLLLNGTIKIVPRAADSVIRHFSMKE